MGDADIFSVDDQGIAPAVFGGNDAEGELEREREYASDASHESSPEALEFLVVPSEPVTPPQDQVTVQLGRTEDDELVLLAFSSSERLAACLGDEQPWVAIPKTQFEQVRRECGAVLAEIDPVLPIN